MKVLKGPGYFWGFSFMELKRSLVTKGIVWVLICFTGLDYINFCSFYISLPIMHLCMYPNLTRLTGPNSWFQDTSGYDYHLHCDEKGNDLFSLLEAGARTVR